MNVQDKLKDLISTFQKCLNAPEPYENDKEKATCKRLVEALSSDLVTAAANTSYAYWYLSSRQLTSTDQKRSMAMREARRHYSYMNQDYDGALQNFTEACEYRRDNYVDLLRVCFDTTFDGTTAEEKTKAKEMADLIRQDMEKQYTIMRGHDKQDHAIMIKYPRTQPGTTEEEYLMSQIYMAERSTAATEFLSLGCKERSMAIYDFGGFDSSNAPPFKMQVTIATSLQKTFPERLQVLVMVEPLFWLRSVLSLLTPFLSESISKRVQMASGQEEKESVFGNLIHEEQATPLMLSSGKLNTPVSLGHFLEDVPFFCSYDDIPCQRNLTEAEKKLHTLGEQSSNTSSSLTSSLWSYMGS